MEQGHIDMLGLAGLIVGIAASIVAVYGIRDVRGQVKLLVEVQRNLTFTKVVHRMLWRLVDPTNKETQYEAMSDMQQFTMLARLADKKQTLDGAQGMATNEVLTLASELVALGMATWKPDIDEDAARTVVESWKNEKNSKLLKSMFGEKGGSIFGSK